MCRASAGLAFSDYELACEVFAADLSGLFLYPSFKADLLYTAEVIELHVMRVNCSLVSHRCQQFAREVITVTAEFYPFGLGTIKGRASFIRKIRPRGESISSPIVR